MWEGSRTRYGLDLMVGSRLYRIRMRFGHSVALKALDQNIGKLCLEELDCGENWYI